MKETRRQKTRKRLSLLIIWTMIMQLCAPASYGAVTYRTAETRKIITGFTDLPESVKNITIPLGADDAAVKKLLAFPETVEATVMEEELTATASNATTSDADTATGSDAVKASDSNTYVADEDVDETADGVLVNDIEVVMDVAVTWELDVEKSAYDTIQTGIAPKDYFTSFDKEGEAIENDTETWMDYFKKNKDTNGKKYTYVAELPEGYQLADGVDLPEIMVTVGMADMMLMAGATENDVASVKIGDAETIYYTVFTAAVSAATTATAPATITLLKDVKTETYIQIPQGKTVTLDLNGCMIDRGTPTSAWIGCVINNLGTLTIQDKGTDPNKIGTITGGNGDTYAGGIFNEGTLTIEGGKITGNHDDYYAGGITNTGYGTLTITGGIITGNTAGDGSKKDYGAGIYSRRPLTIMGGTIQDDIYISDGTVALKGGSFSEITADNNVGSLLAPGYVYKDSTNGNYITDAATLNGKTISNVTVEQAPVTITTQPSDGAPNVPLTVVAETVPAGGTITYQWYKKSETEAADTAVGDKINTYTPTEGGSYYCAVTCGDYTVNTTTANVGVATVTIGEETKTYPTIEAAVTAATGEGVTAATITLLADITPVAAITIPTGKEITLDLNGCTIDRKLTAWAEDGSVIINNGTLTITDSTVTAEPPNATPGTITGGYGIHHGGGINNLGILTIEGGNVTGNKAGGYGAGIYNEGTINLSGGIISGNTTFGSGGGIYNSSLGILTIKGGEISGNTSIDIGGGIYNDYDTNSGRSGTITISGGSITGNTAQNGGGGIYNFGGSITLSGGSITGNKAKSDDGGAIMMQTGTLTVESGSQITITGNKRGDTLNNVFLLGDSSNDYTKTIEVKSAPAEGSSIGITMQTTGTFTTGTGAAKMGANQTCFTSDNEAKAISLNSDGQFELTAIVAEVTAANGKQIGQYGTLAAAITAATNNTGSTVKLLDNVATSNAGIAVTTGTFNLDFNGYTWSHGVGINNTDFVDPALQIAGTANVTLTTTNGGGIRLDGGSIGGGGLLNLKEKGSLTIHGGTYGSGDAANFCAAVEGYKLTAASQLTIDGGTFNGCNNAAFLAFGCSKGSIAISGGTFKNLNGSKLFSLDGTDNANTLADLLAPGYAYKKDGAWVTDTTGATLTGTSITVGLAPVKITSQSGDPGEVTYGYTSAATLQVTAVTDSDKEITYKWKKDGANITENANDGASYTIPTGLGVGGHVYTCDVTCDGFTVTSNDMTLTVKRASGSITDAGNYNKTPTYTGTALADPAAGDFETTAGTLSYEWYSGNPVADGATALEGNPSDADTYTLRVIAADGDNYASTTLDVKVEITAATPTISWGSNTAQTVTYTGSAAVITAPTVTLVNSENYTGTIQYAYKNIGGLTRGLFTDYTDGLPTDAGTYSIKAHIDAAGNYTAANSGEMTLIIEQSTTTVAFKDYTPGGAYTGTALANPTEAQLTITNAAYKDVTFTWYAGSVAEDNKLDAAPTNAGDYVLVASIPATANTKTASVTSDTINISTVALTITAKSQSITYGSEISQATTQVTDSGLVNGETITGITLTASSNQVATENKTITPKDAVISGGGAGNYNISYVAGALTIGKANPTYTIPTNLTATYGQTLADVTLPTGWSWQDSTTKVGNVGTNSFTAVFTPADVSNYNTKNESVSVTVSQADPAIGAVSYNGDTLYDSMTINEVVLTRANTTVLGTLALDAGPTLTAGTNDYRWTFTPEDGTNYKSVSDTIRLTVTADTLQSISIGNTAPTKKEYIYGEKFETAGLTVTATYAHRAGKDVTADVEFGALSGGDTSIELSYTEGGITKSCTVGEITVAKRTVTITGVNAVKDLVYDGNPKKGYDDTGAQFDPAWTGSLTATYYLTDGNTKTYAGKENEGAAPVEAGDFKVVLSIPESDRNYTGQTEAVSFTIGRSLQAALMITGGGTKTYGAADFTLTTTGGSGTGAVSYKVTSGSEVVSVTTEGTVSILKAGSATITATKAGDSNYSDKEETADITVSQAAPTVTFTPDTQSVEYTGIAAEITAPVVTGVKSETPDGSISYAYKKDVAGLASIFSLFDGYTDGLPTDAGAYHIKAQIAAKGNYTKADSSNELKLTITPAQAKITVLPQAKAGLVYTGSVQALITAGSVAGGTLEYKLGNGDWDESIPEAVSAGEYTVYYRVEGDGNHSDIAEASLTATIAKAGLTVSGGTVTTKKWDGTVTAEVTALTFAGLVNGETFVIGTDYSVGTPEFATAAVESGKTVNGTASLVANDKTNNYSLTGTYNGVTGEIILADGLAAPIFVSMNDTENTYTFESTTGIVYEYRINDGNWTEVTATGESTSISVGNIDIAVGKLEVRSKETGTHAAGAVLTNTTAFTAAIEGTVIIEGTASYGSTLTASATGTQTGATLSYTWKAGETVVQAASAQSTYVIGRDVVGKKITVEVTADGYVGKLTSAATAVVSKKKVTPSITVNGTYTYTGEQLKPTDLTVKDGTEDIDSGDYDVTYGENINAGKGSVTITLKNIYDGYGTKEFAIAKATPTITIQGSMQKIYDGLTAVTIAKDSTNGYSFSLEETPVFTFYTDSSCGTKTGTTDALGGAAAEGTAPKNVGIYYVKASYAGSDNYNTVTSEGALTYTITAKSVMITAQNQTIAYKGDVYDVSALFAIDENAGDVSYVIVDGGTGRGTSDGSVLTITKAGTITIKVNTKAHGNYGAGEATAVLTVTLGTGRGTVTLGDWTYGESAAKPVVTSTTNGTDHVSYLYKKTADADSAYTSAVPKDAGNYTVKAVFAATDLYVEATATDTFTISKAAAPVITYPTADGIYSDQKLSASTLTGGSTEYGAFAWTDGSVVSTAGNHSYGVTFTPNEATKKNYEAFEAGQLTGTVAVHVVERPQENDTKTEVAVAKPAVEDAPAGASEEVQDIVETLKNPDTAPKAEGLDKAAESVISTDESGQVTVQAGNTVVTGTQAVEALEKENISTAGKETKLVVEPYIQVKVQDIVTEGDKTVLVMDIKALYNVKATTAASTGDMVEAGSDKAVNTVTIGTGYQQEVSEPVTISIPLPKNFAKENLFIRHTHDGIVSYYEVTVDGDMATFVNEHGFSKFELMSDNQTGTLVFDSGVAAVTYNLANVGDVLPTAVKSGYTFQSWNIGGKNYMTFTLELLELVNDADDKEMAAVAVFTKNSSGSGSSGGGSGSGSSYSATHASGWSNEGTKGWRFYDSNGTYARNAWRQVNENGVMVWYHFGADGYMNTGWFLDNDGSWYYLNPVSDGTKGAMKSGWLTDALDGHRYYLDPKSGKMAVGWVLIDGVWYYFNDVAPAASGWYFDQTKNLWAYDPKAQTPLGALVEGEKK